jgi:uncharacterized peroxidase-related enzyme
MTWIRTVPPGEATGILKRVYSESIFRAGKVFNILRCQSIRPEVLNASLDLYKHLMLSPQSPLSRVQREMIAVVVSRTNRCHY